MNFELLDARSCANCLYCDLNFEYDNTGDYEVRYGCPIHDFDAHHADATFDPPAYEAFVDTMYRTVCAHHQPASPQLVFLEVK